MTLKEKYYQRIRKKARDTKEFIENYCEKNGYGLELTIDCSINPANDCNRKICINDELYISINSEDIDSFHILTVVTRILYLLENEFSSLNSYNSFENNLVKNDGDFDFKVKVRGEEERWFLDFSDREEEQSNILTLERRQE